LPHTEDVYEREVASIVGELGGGKPLAELLIGIDGPGGAGKSTLARELAARIDASIIQADDFYRPGRDRRAETGIGEAYDWRRLQDQVLEPLKSGQPARYQRYDWQEDALAEWHDVPSGPLIVEGIYVLRTELRPYFDYSIWVEAPSGQRLRRGLARDGSGARRQWDEWMELEDEYVRRQRPDQYANRRVSGGA
jgi:uridine kinase